MTNQQLTDLVILKSIMKEKDPKKRDHRLSVFYYNQTVRKEREGK